MEIMDGTDSELFSYFKTLLFKGIFALRRHANQLMSLIEMMYKNNAKFGCFGGGDPPLEVLKERFKAVSLSEENVHQLLYIYIYALVFGMG